MEKEPIPAARPPMSRSEHGNANRSRLSRIKANVLKKPYMAAGLAAMLLITFGFSYYMGYLTESEEETPPYAESQNPPTQEEVPPKEIPIIAEQKVEEPPVEKEEFDDRLNRRERINPEAEIARQTFLVYQQAVVNGDYETAYSMLSSEQKRRVGDFNNYFNSQSDMLNGVITSIYTMDSSPESVTIGYRLTIDDRISDRWSRTQVFRGQVTLVERGGDWYILNAQSRRAEELVKRDL